MAYSKIRQPKLSDVIEQQLEFLILEGTLRPGEKLPPERELAKQFDVSRPSLREAIQRLEAKGLLLRRQGGGTFVQSSLWQSFSDPLVELLSDHPESQFDLLETRHALEGIAAYYAALRSTDEDRVRIRELHQAIERAQQSGDRRRVRRRRPVSNRRHRSGTQCGAAPSATLHGADAGPERSSEF
jgi:GntR family transcriptional repressor for pyruvate dehydrogenase complex